MYTYSGMKFYSSYFREVLQGIAPKHILRIWVPLAILLVMGGVIYKHAKLVDLVQSNRFDYLGDAIFISLTINTITLLLRGQGLAADWFGGIIDISNGSIELFQQAIETILRGAKPTPVDLANAVPDTIGEKHDPFLPKEIRDLGYGARLFDVDGTWEWMSKLRGYQFKK